MSKALEEKSEKERQQAEESKDKTGIAMVPNDPDAPKTHIGIMVEILGKERIKQSIEKVLDEVLSGQQKQSTSKDGADFCDQWIAEQVNTLEEVSV